MKRSWIGLGLLVGLLAASLLASFAMAKICREDSGKLHQAVQAALAEDWTKAAMLTAQARGSWEDWEFFRCAMADHNPAEEIDSLFSVLEIYCRRRQTIAFAAVCQETAERLEALGDAQRLNLHNLL